MGKEGLGERGQGEKKPRRRSPRPPDPRFEVILAHYNSRKTWPDEVEPAHQRALQKVLWFQPNLTAAEFIRRLDNAFQSDDVYPFYGRAFSLKDFCANHLKFRDGPIKRRTESTSNGSKPASSRSLPKKSVAHLVAERGGSYTEERDRLEREGSKDRIEWYNETIRAVEAFREFTGWNYKNADSQETCLEFLEEIQFAWEEAEEVRKKHGKETLPGILMCKISDKCIDERRKEGGPVIPIPRNFFERKDELRKMERELAEA